MSNKAIRLISYRIAALEDGQVDWKAQTAREQAVVDERTLYSAKVDAEITELKASRAALESLL